MPKNLHAILLAAGKGTRINATDRPKVLYQLAGRPMIPRVLDQLKAIGINNPVIVIGFKGKEVKEVVGKNYPNVRYVCQRRQLGTAHAARKAQKLLEGKAGLTFIVNGDNPLILPKTLRQMIKRLHATGAAVAIASAKAPDELGLGCLITDAYGHVVKIVEEKNATTDQRRKFHWKNAGPWLVENKFLWQNLPKIAKNPVSKEYYLTDLLELAVEQGNRAIAVPVTEVSEAIGVNTLEHLKQAERVVRQAHHETSQNQRRHPQAR